MEIGLQRRFNEVLMKTKMIGWVITLGMLIGIGAVRAGELPASYVHCADGEYHREADSDVLLGESNRSEQQSCTTSGYCYGYGYNSSSGQYEYFYGYQMSCQGHQDRTVTTRTYQRQDGSRYDDVSYGSWSFCQI